MARQNRPPSAAEEQALVDAWTHPVGTPVVVKTSRGDVRTKTSTGAQLLGDHTAVVWLDDISGCYSLRFVSLDTST